ncbi:MAG: hypothetical protein AABZ55_01300 [Bdellovibrionota bacterium]
MKKLGIGILAVLALTAVEQKSHAFGFCATNRGDYAPGCPQSHIFYITSTTFTGPFGIIMDGSADLSNALVRDAAFVQADQTLRGQSDAIVGTNIVNVLAKKFGAKDDEAMARALQALEASGSELSDANIRQALK